MKRYAALCAGLLTVMLALFLVVEALDIPLLAEADPLGDRTGAVAAALGVTLLVVDVALPVPSSVVMITHGALFGALVGTALSVLGSLGSFSVGFALGRRGEPVVKRLVPEEERQRADRFLVRWGVVGVVLSRPVPLLAEAVSFVAGTSPLPWRPTLVAAALGCLPAAAVYAVAGAVAASFASGAVVFIAVVVLALGVGVLVVPRGGVPGESPP
ncbi:MAG TPA: VTT domain-containing protein [Acidimicrobiales bacterium]|nr:VTT domain-containing protein [Acidimicrobiales bacterium]